MENGEGKVIEIPNAPVSEKTLVEAKPYLLTDEERQIVVNMCDVCIKTLGLRGVQDVLKIVKIFS